MKNQEAARISETDLSETRTSEIIRITQERASELSEEMTNSERGRKLEAIQALINEVDSRAKKDPSHASAAQAMRSYVHIVANRKT